MNDSERMLEYFDAEERRLSERLCVLQATAGFEARLRWYPDHEDDVLGFGVYCIEYDERAGYKMCLFETPVLPREEALAAVEHRLALRRPS